MFYFRTVISGGGVIGGLLNLVLRVWDLLELQIYVQHLIQLIDITSSA